MQPIALDEIHKLLREQLPGAEIFVDGDGYKYQVTVVCDSFANLATLQRHKKVYALLQEPITGGRLHALTIKTFSRQEWQAAGETGRAAN